MTAPYEKFAKSEHRELGCKACHQPTLVARSKMALTQIIENPDSLGVHAEVPNERCAECHVNADSAKWQQVANSAGHRVHFESQDTVLKGLQCVQCHSSALHEFAASDKTCGQAGCHENTKIKLGKMGKLTIHCAACHEFSLAATKSAVPSDSLHGVLQPGQGQCLGCHEMQKLIGASFPKDPKEDPHGGKCGACHDPHKQTTPAQAVESCKTCHQAIATESPIHKELANAAPATCTKCHAAHEFKAKLGDCTSCHEKILSAPPSKPGKDAFAHAQHKSVQCQSCHDNAPTHGTIKAVARDCQSCHHSATAAVTCTKCHERAELAKRVSRTQQFALSTGAKTRTMPFEHARHDDVACTKCHTGTGTMSAANVQCNACHVEHHKPAVTCMQCHPPVRKGAHTRNVHLGCAGSGCHSKLPAALASVPHTRQFCTACHQDMVSHKPAGNCAECHKLPPARGAGQ